ncbi:MAG: M55 family metallopeptidase [Gemmatimonadota bacterium]
MRRFFLVGLLLAAGALPGPAHAQAAPDSAARAATRERNALFRAKRVPHQAGFRVFIVPDMEGMGSAVDVHEVIAGNEGEHYKTLTSPDYWDRFRSLLTQEVNATIKGARLAGAASFVVNEGHGGNLFANVLPGELDSTALLVRGFPKPLIMITGLDSTFGTLMFTGAHANAGSPGVMAHSYAFDAFTVNGKKLNEVGINALIAGEMGVSVSLISGDDVMVEETKEMLGNGVIGVVVKQAVGRSAAITWSPAKVRHMLQVAAAEAVRRERRGDFKPLVMDKPYTVDFTMRKSYPDSIVAAVAALPDFKLERTGDRSFRLVTSSAREMGYLLDTIEETVLH